MNLQSLKPSYRKLPKEQRLRWLAKVKANRSYPTGRMCNYLSWKLLPPILTGDSSSGTPPTLSLDIAESPSLVDLGLLPPHAGVELAYWPDSDLLP